QEQVELLSGFNPGVDGSLLQTSETLPIVRAGHAPGTRASPSPRNFVVRLPALRVTLRLRALEPHHGRDECPPRRKAPTRRVSTALVSDEAITLVEEARRRVYQIANTLLVVLY